MMTTSLETSKSETEDATEALRLEVENGAAAIDEFQRLKLGVLEEIAMERRQRQPEWLSKGPADLRQVLAMVSEMEYDDVRYPSDLQSGMPLVQFHDRRRQWNTSV